MTIRNLTPHSVDFYSESAFQGLEQLSPTTWVADSVSGSAILSVESEGMLRIATSTTEANPIEGIPTVVTVYGNVTGVPDNVSPDDVLVVSLPALSMATAAGHPLASQMMAPYKVVRQRGNTSTALGAMGLTK
jgi:hypothetical protein